MADWRRIEPDRLQALRTVEVHAIRLLEGMIAEYVALGPQAAALERRLSRAAFELTTALAQAFEHVLKLIREATAHRSLLGRAPDLVVRLMRHREVELLLTLCRYDIWQRARWKSLHDLYRHARAAGIATSEVIVSRRANGTGAPVTPEEIYLRILLLDVAGRGHLLPVEIAATRRALARWTGRLALRPLPAAQADAPPALAGFCVDPNGGGGLARVATASAEDCLWLDTTPLAAALDAELAQSRDAASASAAANATAARKLLLLSRLASLYAPTPLHVQRRGERKSVALVSVQATIGGLHSVYRMLRDEAQGMRSTVAAPSVDEITITEPGSYGMRADGGYVATDDGTAAFPATATFGVPLPSWQVRDSSDSGCRLRGRATDVRRLLPGSLMAFRDDETAHWNLAVVRRLRKLVGTNIELGVERLGRNPQRVILHGTATPDANLERFVALCLPESSACPRVPIKTLLLPACEFAPGRIVTMVSTSREVVVRLKEPLDQQADFVWTSFDFVGDAHAAR